MIDTPEFHDKWDERFMDLAAFIARWSKDPSTKVGAVIVDDKRRVLSMGYNGFPRGVLDDPDRLMDRPTKYQMIVHAEMNAILNALGPVEGSTLYVYPLPVCNECAKLVIQAGIKRIVRPHSIHNERWAQQTKVADDMFREAGVEIGYLD